MANLTNVVCIILVGAFGWRSMAHAGQNAGSARPHVESADTANATRAQVDLGKFEYLSSCAPCHGADGKGDGPVSAELKTKPADLTVLAKKNGGIFPVRTTYEFIEGRKLVAAHGTREMPIWGQVYNRETLSVFFDPKSLELSRLPGDSMAVVRDRILSLIEYLNRIQER